MTSAAPVQRNLELIPWYVGGVGTYAWMSIFFLYMASRVSVAEVLLLEAIYYLSVVVLEVPSGYFSDRVGRRPTLILASGALVASYLLFALWPTFVGFAVAQVLLATGLAFNSGTDTSMHYASLVATGSEASYGAREARLGTLSFAVGAVAAVGGGALGLLDLGYAYLLSGAGALVALVAALGMVEPREGDRRDEGEATGFGASLIRCTRLIGTRPLGWLFAASLAATVVNHVPYEFYQPYLERLPDLPWPSEGTPLVAGLHVALAWALAAPVAARSVAWQARLGLTRHVLLGLGIQVALIGLMALWLHPAVAVLLVARTVPRALLDAPMNAAVTPLLPPTVRATYLSLQSLAGRLSYGALLLFLSGVASLTPESPLSLSITIAAIVAVALWLALAATARLGRST